MYCVRDGTRMLPAPNARTPTPVIGTVIDWRGAALPLGKYNYDNPPSCPVATRTGSRSLTALTCGRLCPRKSTPSKSITTHRSRRHHCNNVVFVHRSCFASVSRGFQSIRTAVPLKRALTNANNNGRRPKWRRRRTAALQRYLRSDRQPCSSATSCSCTLRHRRRSDALSALLRRSSEQQQ